MLLTSTLTLTLTLSPSITLTTKPQTWWRYLPWTSTYPQTLDTTEVRSSAHTEKDRIAVQNINAPRYTNYTEVVSSPSQLETSTTVSLETINSRRVLRPARSNILTIKALDIFGWNLFLAIVVFYTQKKPRRIKHLQNQEPFSSDPYFRV